MTRKQLAEAIYEIEKDLFGLTAPKEWHVKCMLNGIGYAKPLKKADLEKRLADLTE